MRLGQKWFEQDGKLIHQKVNTAAPALATAQRLRDAGAESLPNGSKVIGVIPGWLMAEWLKEAGVTMDDHEAARQVVDRKMMDADNAQLRVWFGTY